MTGRRDQQADDSITGERGGVGSAVGRLPVVLLLLLLMVLAMSWQFVTDASRAVPAFDTAFYQWRVELLRVADPGALIELRGAQGALAGGYRVAEPVLGALMRGVGGVGASTPTVVLSILFRILAAVGLASFVWRHRRSWLVFYLTLLTVPALFLLQRFFGFMDNFLTLSLLVGVLLLLEPLRTSWSARIAVTALLFVGGLSHPTTVAIFLLSMGAVAAYRLVRGRSMRAVVRADGPLIGAGTAAVVLTAVFWIGGSWGPRSSFSDAAVPPPETASYFLNRSVDVLKNLQPFDQSTAPAIVVVGGVAALFGLFLLGLVHLVLRLIRGEEHFAEVSLGWTLPLAGMLGFLFGAAYPYFRFFNATLAPLLLIALGMAVLIGWSLRVARPRFGGITRVVVLAVVGALLAGWWLRGLSEWNGTGTWLTREVRSTTAAAQAYLKTKPPGTKAVFVTDAAPGDIVPYGKYKEFVNATFAGLAPDQIDDAGMYFGRIEDLLARRASRSNVPDPAYNDVAADTARDIFRMIDRNEGGVVMFMPAVFNEFSTNGRFLQQCGEPECVQLSGSGLYVLDPPQLPAAPISEQGVAAARRAAEDAEAFADDPPGPLANLASTVLSILRLGLLFVVPGWLFSRSLPARTWPETVALIPILSIAAVTTVGVLVLALLRDPLSAGMAWGIWALTVVIGAAASLWPRRRRPSEERPIPYRAAPGGS